MMMNETAPIPRVRAAVATLIATSGSSPRAAGARMWVDERGGILGSVTIGGCVDARVIEESGRVIETGEPTIISMSLGDEDAQALGMTCGGTVEVLVELVDPASRGDSLAPALRRVHDEARSGRRVALVRPLGALTDRIVVGENGEVSGTLGTAALDESAAAAAGGAIAEGRSSVRIVEAGGEAHRLYIEVHAPPLTVVIFGATHVAMPLAELARVLGMRVVVVDGRATFATRERFPNADELIVGMPSEIAERLRMGPTTFVTLLSHDYKYDLPVLRAVLESPAAYIGVLGSARRGKALLEFLAGEGVSPEALSRVRVPTGLDIGAATAEEIALSVLAEALAVQRGRGGGAMRDRIRAAEAVR